MQHLKVARVHFPLACSPGFAFLDPAGLQKLILRQVRLEGYPGGCPASVLKIGEGLLHGILAFTSS